MDAQMAFQLIAALEKGLTASTEEVQRSSDTVNVVDGLFAIAQALEAVAGEVRQLNQMALHMAQLAQQNRGAAGGGRGGG